MAKTFVVMGPNAWGSSKTSIAAAKKNMKANLSSWLTPGKDYPMGVYEVEGFEGVSGVGYIVAKAKPVELEVTTFRVRR